MNEELSQQIQTAQAELEPEFKTLRTALSALKAAARLAADEKQEALAMQKALVKLEQVAPEVDRESMTTAVHAFGQSTQEALGALAFEFARDLKEVFEEQGKSVSGRPPTLIIDPFVLQIDMAARKAQWFYGKEALTRPIPLSIKGIVKAYDQQYKKIVGREIKTADLLEELYKAWQDSMEKRTRKPQGGRINFVEVYSQLTLNRQATRFWNAPSRSTFKDYPRELFVRDMVLLQDSGETTLTKEGQQYQLRLGGATKSQADSAARSIWLPNGAVDGEYYSDLTFEE
jgi:hypothetical protein